MKNSKLFYLFIISFSFFCLSCEKEQNDNNIDESVELVYTNSKSINNYKHQAQLIKSASALISQNDSKSINFLDQEIDQKFLDDYAIILGVDTISLEDFEAMIGLVPEIQENGIPEMIQNLQARQFTRNSLQQMAFGEVIDGLESMPEFQTLPLNERELLLLTNNVILEFGFDQNRNPDDVPCPSTACGVGFGIILGGAGASLCGIPCAIGGFILGVAIGTSGKNR